MMANVQIENGYTKIANELLEAIIYKVNNAAWLKILFFLIRITYGYNKKEVETTIWGISVKTGFDKPMVINSLWEMHDRHLITIKLQSKEVIKVSINKNYDLWKV
jgi:phage replication O-like protein O